MLFHLATSKYEQCSLLYILRIYDLSLKPPKHVQTICATLAAVQIIWSCVVWFDCSCNVVKNSNTLIFFAQKAGHATVYSVYRYACGFVLQLHQFSDISLTVLVFFFLSKCLIWIQIERSGCNLRNYIGRKWNYGRWKAVRIKTAIWRNKLNVCKTWKKKPTGIECARK